MNTMYRVLFVLVLTLGVLAVAPAQDENDEDERDEQDEAVLADVIAELEEMNDRLWRMLGEDEDYEGFEGRAPDVGGGGGQFFPVRFFIDMPRLNTYVDSLGSFPGDPAVAGSDTYPLAMFPFVNSGGGTWRWSASRNFQIGMDFWNGGFSTLGFVDHNTDPLGPNDTADENGDGLDDYYSYANYGMGYWSVLASGKVEPVEEVLFLTGTARVGLGGETFSVERNRRDVVTSTLSIVTGSAAWNRALLQLGAAVGVQVALDDANVVRLGLEGGFDYYVPISPWMPGTGIHRTTAAPPADWNPMNAWVRIGPQFRY